MHYLRNILYVCLGLFWSQSARKIVYFENLFVYASYFKRVHVVDQGSSCYAQARFIIFTFCIFSTTHMSCTQKETSLDVHEDKKGKNNARFLSLSFSLSSFFSTYMNLSCSFYLWTWYFIFKSFIHCSQELGARRSIKIKSTAANFNLQSPV